MHRNLALELWHGSARLAACTSCCVLACVLASGCQPEPARGPSVAPSTPRARATFAGSARLISSAAQGVQFPLPDAAAWQIKDDEHSGFRARHAATASGLFVHGWRSDAWSRNESCEEQARARGVALPRLGEERIEHRRLMLARDYELWLDATVQPGTGTEGLTGYAIAFGGDGLRCLAVVFSTQASGAGAEQQVAERLGIVIQTVFVRLRLRSIDDRVFRPRL